MADIVNFYEELGIGRDDNVAQIHESLRNLKLQLTSKVARPSSQRESWMRQLALIGEAESVFRDDDSRERYDVELARADMPEAPAIDWTTRAWNYYLVGDNGAALVAARKAKEQSPGEVMPFVVSAWVLLKDGEPKQAKHDADEAFVLDELTMDSVDVQEVRGTVYLVLKEYDRALASFDRALTKASEGEKPELYWRRALTYDGMGRPTQAYESGCSGLQPGVPLSSTVREGLELVTSNAIHRLDTRRDPVETITRYTHRRDEVARSSIVSGSKERIIRNIDENIARWARVRDLHGLCARDAAVPPPPPDAAAARAVSATGIGCAAVAALMLGGLMSFANPAAGLITLLLAGGGIYAYNASQRNKRNELERVTEAYSAARARLASNQEELRRFRPDPIRLKPSLGR